MAAVLAALGTVIMASGLVVMSAPSASATTTSTWTGQGGDNLPCDGTLQWNFTNGDAVDPVLHVADATYAPTSKNGNVYKFHTSGDGVSADPLTEVSVVYSGPAGGQLTISHCTEAPPSDACPELSGDQPEGFDCTAPEDEVQRRTVVGDPDCEAGTVTTEIQERTRSYTWDGDSFEPGPWSDWETVDTSVSEVTEEQCPPREEVVVPEAPAPSAPDCDTDGSLVVPEDDDAFAWTVVRDGGDAGTSPYGPGVYDVTVESLLGEFVGGGTTRTFEDVTVLAATGEGEGCVLGVEKVAPAVTFTDPTCAEPRAAAWSGKLTDVIDYTASRSAKRGTTITVTAAVKPELSAEVALADGVETVFTHAYPSLDDLGCVKGVESFAPKPSQDAERPPTVLGTQAAVPTAVDAGLAGAPTGDASSPTALVGQLLVAGGLLLLLTGGWVGLGRRDRGAHTG